MLTKEWRCFFPRGDVNFLYRLNEKELKHSDSEQSDSNKKVALAYNYGVGNYDINVISEKY